jgi:hypothetical protein
MHKPFPLQSLRQRGKSHFGPTKSFGQISSSHALPAKPTLQAHLPSMHKPFPEQSLGQALRVVYNAWRWQEAPPQP